jgi:phosphoribosylglycinamide formyltransferase-1
MKKIILFASGNGSNVENIIEYFKESEVTVVGVFTNNSNATISPIPGIVFSISCFCFRI